MQRGVAAAYAFDWRFQEIYAANLLTKIAFLMPMDAAEAER